MTNFFIKIKDKDLAGRIGKIKTKHGVIETPYLFPVINPIRQELPLKDIVNTGFNAVITNAYLTYKKKWGKNIHELLGEKNIVIMTDSGAYQLLQYGDIEITNKQAIELQMKLDSDIAVILDVPTGDALEREKAVYTVKETLKRGREAKDIIDNKRLWVLPIQGGVHLDLVDYSAKESSDLNYDIYALGSPTRFMERYEYRILMQMIWIARRNIIPEKPLHLFGAGHPMMIPFAISMGIDLFDSASYILFARNGRYMMDYGTIKLEQLNYFPCTCPICSKYTPRELKEMNREERTRLLALHNLYMIKKSLEKTKQYIKEGRLWNLLEEYSRKHPSLYEAFKSIIEKTSWLEKYTPRVKTPARSIYVFNKESRYNPYIQRTREYIEKHYAPPPLYNNLHIKFLQKGINNVSKKTHIVYYAPVIGVIPAELTGIHPFGHFIIPFTINNEEINDVADTIIKYIQKHRQKYKNSVKITICKEHNALYNRLIEKIGETEGITIQKQSCRKHNVNQQFFEDPVHKF